MATTVCKHGNGSTRDTRLLAGIVFPEFGLLLLMPSIKVVGAQQTVQKGRCGRYSTLSYMSSIR